LAANAAAGASVAAQSSKAAKGERGKIMHESEQEFRGTGRAETRG
jgi:hypothetical protein